MTDQIDDGIGWVGIGFHVMTLALVGAALERYLRRQGALKNVNFKHLRKWERQVDYSHKGYPPAIIDRQVPQVECFLSSKLFFLARHTSIVAVFQNTRRHVERQRR